MTNRCRGCDRPSAVRVVDLGALPQADFFPPADTPPGVPESSHLLAMNLCPACGLAQLAEDDTVPDEPRGVEPLALQLQAADAVRTVADAGRLRGDTVLEFGSPHGGTWLPLLDEHGLHSVVDGPADVVLDCFGIMHEPDQRAAFARRAEAVADDGVLLLQFHSLLAILGGEQWNALRHGHFAYYSLTALRYLLADAGLHIDAAWQFDLYGGTVLVAAGRERPSREDATVARILADERAAGVCDPQVVRRLHDAADRQTGGLRRSLESAASAGTRVYAYGAASRAVALFARAGIDSGLVAGVADASPLKQGRRMPGTDVPIVDPPALLGADPDVVLLTLPDLLPELRERFPELEGRWVPLGNEPLGTLSVRNGRHPGVMRP
ncbi:transferase [Rhodococcus sp. (in: high G+C Gram-positive bacteria)]|uniref:transferase n=1 Tax=Rhodococcus sp. TaxID=1831 RepID=UPI00388F9E05